MAELSRTLGEIDTNVPLEDTLENLKVEEWDKAKVLEIFEELRFQRYIDKLLSISVKLFIHSSVFSDKSFQLLIILN